MSHLDEGTLHALLDGELETNEVAEIQAHLGACSACGLRLREVKEFLSESDRLVASVEMEDAPAPSAPRPEPRPRPRPPTRAAATEPWNEPPPLLLPDNETAADRRDRRFRRLNQAAMLAVVVGIGLVWNNLYRGGTIVPTSTPTSAPSDSALPQPTAVVSAAETTRPDSPAVDTQVAEAPVRTPTTPDAKAAAPKAPAPAPKAPTPAPEPAAALAQAPEKQLAERDDLQSVDSIAESADSGTVGDSAAAEDIATVRARAADALAELDRERRRNQAAAATAALDAERRRRAAAVPATTTRAETVAAPAPPPPLTPEQRAGVYLRIGLDEASRQLGAPAHVIEGMVPMFMGLAQGSTVSGADTTRPVVRVVYQDPQGRLILLDQQRLRSGQSGFRSSALAWTQGEHALWLHGEPNAEVLRTYRPRVR
jgi:hypothetical protein